MFVGYPFGVKGYRVWIQDEGKCTTSRNVIFHEHEIYKDTLQAIKSDTEKLSSGTEEDRKKKKKVSFSDELIIGPTPKRNDEGASTSGGVLSDQSEDSDSEGSQGSGFRVQ